MGFEEALRIVLSTAILLYESQRDTLITFLLGSYSVLQKFI